MRKEAQLLLQDIVTGELIPAYGKVIKEYISRGEAAPGVYKEQFNRIVKRLYRRHRRDIQALGYGSVAKFAERLWEVFEPELDQLVRWIADEVDTYAFFERQEDWMINQRCDIEDHKLLWQSNIDKYGPFLVKSPEWKSRMTNAAAYEMRKSGVSRQFGVDKIRRMLPGLAYEELAGKTGPSVLTMHLHCYLQYLRGVFLGHRLAAREVCLRRMLWPFTSPSIISTPSGGGSISLLREY